MAKRKYKKRKSKSLNWFYIVATSVFLSFFVLVGLTEYIGFNIPFLPTLEEINQMVASYGSDKTITYQKVQGDLQVHILDVGQADSILIIAPDKTVLIDAGENNMGPKISQYLAAHDVAKIDILINTHPHSDHIGGIDYIIDNIDVGEIIMPKIPEAIVPTTKTYTDVLAIILEKKLKVSQPIPDKSYDLGGGAVLSIIAPLAEYGDLNNMSVVTRLDFGEASFLFTGDCSKESEKDILGSGANIDTDILSVSHHGSNTSSTSDYLEQISPKLSVISVGADNSYGHPHKEVLKRLQEYGNIYRTDTLGNIIFTSDGNDINVMTEKKPELNITLNAA